MHVIDGSGDEDVVEYDELENSVKVTITNLLVELSKRFLELSGEVPLHQALANLMDPRLKGIDLPKQKFEEAEKEALRRLEILLDDEPVKETVVKDYQEEVSIESGSFEIYDIDSNDAEDQVKLEIPVDSFVPSPLDLPLTKSLQKKNQASEILHNYLKEPRVGQKKATNSNKRLRLLMDLKTPAIQLLHF